MPKCSWACASWADPQTGARYLDVICSCGPCTWLYRARAEQSVPWAWVIRHLHAMVAEEYAKWQQES